MSIRKYFFMSLALAILAVGLQGAALRQFSRSSQTIARGVGLPVQERTALRIEADRYVSRGGVVGYIGLAFALASIGFVIVSARRHAPAWRSLTFALLGFYVILQFVLV